MLDWKTNTIYIARFRNHIQYIEKGKGSVYGETEWEMDGTAIAGWRIVGGALFLPESVSGGKDSRFLL